MQLEGATPRSEIEARLARLQAAMRPAGLDAVFLLQNADLFYFSGTVQDSILCVPREGPAVLFVRRSLERARGESGVPEIVPYANLRELPALLKGRGLGDLTRVGLEFDVLPVQHYTRLCTTFPMTQFAEASPIIRQVRAIKSPFEISLMRRAAEIQDRMAKRLAAVARVGMTELELAAEVEAEGRRHGHQGFLRYRRMNQECLYGHLLAGPNGAVPGPLESATGGTGLSPALGNGVSVRPIAAREPIMLDYAGCYAGYISDLTRTFAIGGLSEEMVRAYEASVRVLEEAERHLRPGVRADQVYKAALSLAEELGYADRFMNVPPVQVHFIGHGIGVELDEIPYLARGFDMALEAGMTVAVEPKIVFPGQGVVGVEDTFLVTEGEPERITFTPRDLVII